MKLSTREIALLTRYCAHQKNLGGSVYTRTITEVERRSDTEYDLTIRGAQHKDGQFSVFYSAWLPLGCIGDMVDWCRPEVVEMCDFGSLDAGWSAIRDSEESSIWAIFQRFVLLEAPRTIVITEQDKCDPGALAQCFDPRGEVRRLRHAEDRSKPIPVNIQIRKQK